MSNKKGTVLCRHWKRGKCDLGDCCNFLHGVPLNNSPTSANRKNSNGNHSGSNQQSGNTRHGKSVSSTQSQSNRGNITNPTRTRNNRTQTSTARTRTTNTAPQTQASNYHPAPWAKGLKQSPTTSEQTTLDPKHDAPLKDSPQAIKDTSATVNYIKTDAKLNAKLDANTDANSDAQSEAEGYANGDATSDVNNDEKINIKTDAKSQAKASVEESSSEESSPKQTPVQIHIPPDEPLPPPPPEKTFPYNKIRYLYYSKIDLKVPYISLQDIPPVLHPRFTFSQGYLTQADMAFLEFVSPGSVLKSHYDGYTGRTAIPACLYHANPASPINSIRGNMTKLI